MARRVPKPFIGFYLDAIRFSTPLAIGSVRLVLDPGALICFVPPNYAARRSSEKPMMPSEMSCRATNNSAFETALCVRGRYGQGEDNGRAADKHFHLDSPIGPSDNALWSWSFLCY